MVSATDPAAVVATFKRLSVSRSVATLVDGESLLNDGTGLVLFAIAVRAVSEPVGPVDAIVSFVCGGRGQRGHRAGGRSPRRPPRRRRPATTWSSSRSRSSWPTAPISSPMSSTLSGVIATVTAAVVFGNFGPGRALTETGADAIDTVWEFLAYLLTAVVFLLVGLAIPPARLLGSLAPIAWAVAAMLVARALSCTCWSAGVSRVAPLPGSPGRCPGPWLHVLFWAGLRGAVAVAMALRLADGHAPAGAAAGHHVRGRAVHAGRPGDHDRAGGRAGPADGDALMPGLAANASRPAARRARQRRGRSGHADGRIRHHSARVCRMLMLWRMPSPIAMLTSDAPPWRHERQRDAGDRHDPHDHPDVDHELEEDHRGDAGREHRPERVARPPARRRGPATGAARRARRARGRRRTRAPRRGRRTRSRSSGPAGSRPAPACRWSGPRRTSPPEPTAICDW